MEPDWSQIRHPPYPRSPDDLVCGGSEWGTPFYPTTNLNSDGKQWHWRNWHRALCTNLKNKELF